MPLLLLVLCTIGCDRVTKSIAIVELRGRPAQSFLGDTFRLVYVENPGAFLGMGSRLPPAMRHWLFTIGVGTVFAALVWFSRTASLALPGWIGLCLICAGGVSNLVDRAVSGVVVDFMNVGVGWLRTGIFNVADMAITAGALLLALGSKTRWRRWSEPG